MNIKAILKKTHLFNTCRFFYYKYKIRNKGKQIIQIAMDWRDQNRHNFTEISNGLNDCPFPIDLVKVGKATYGPLHVIAYRSGDEQLIIGSYCSIAQGVKFILGGEHSLARFATYPFERHFINKESIEAFIKGKIIIEDDVWIGAYAMILSGVTLRQGTVVAAGSVVTKSSEPYSIIGGNPARLIRKRFSDNIISQLLSLNIAKMTSDFIIENIELLKKTIDQDTIEILKERLNGKNSNIDL